MNKDITLIPEDYIVVHSKTKNIQKLFDDGSCVYEVDKECVPLVRCKDCIHFHYDFPYIYVPNAIPVLIHEVCDFWGDGCKTSENAYCSHAERGE